MVISKTSEREYDFTLRLSGLSEIATEVEDALFEAGCDDATLFATGGQVFLAFTRSAGSRQEAIESALRDIRAAGFDAEELTAAVSPPPAS